MVDKRVIEQVLLEQLEEIVALQDISLCPRSLGQVSAGQRGFFNL